MAEDLRQREAQLLAELRRHLVERVNRAREIRRRREAEESDSVQGHRAARRELKTTLESRYGSTHEEYDAKQREVHERFERRRAELLEEETRRRREAESRFQKESSQSKENYRASRFETQAAYSARRTGIKQEFVARKRTLAEKQKQIQRFRSVAADFLESCRMGSLARRRGSKSELATTFTDPVELLTIIETDLAKLSRFWMARLVGPRLGLIFVATFIVAIVVTAPMMKLGMALVAATVTALVGGGAVAALLYWTAKREVSRRYDRLTSLLDRADELCARGLSGLSEEFRDRRTQLRSDHRDEWKVARRKNRSELVLIVAEHDQTLRDCDERYPRLLAEITQERDEALREIQTTYGPRLRELRTEFDERSARIDEESTRRKEDSEALFQREWTELLSECRQKKEEIEFESAAIAAQVCDLFPSWDDPRWPGHSPPAELPTVLPLGSLAIDPARFDGAQAVDPEVREFTPAPFTLPALLDQWSIILAGQRDQLGRANQILLNLMLRILTTVPAGKTRWTLIDPGGLGQDFASFMHLADYDEQLVGPRIWTESAHIEERLSDLTEHMENVIQKYLRNQYETIEAYNEMAGEIAEPYRILVIARFPTGFNESALRRLLSIMNAGRRCGVFVMMSADARATWPMGMKLADFERHAATVTVGKETMRWADPEFTSYPLSVEMPASADQVTRVLSEVGERAKSAARVEVPFRVVLPAADAWWTSDSRRELRVPIGRTGATRLQQLSLGQGTAQHVLIAGKTGSGKSTLLHALITSAAVRYAPTDLEFYLVDFKKGVEFKTYATHSLPHARVIAIESEREFGLSVMRRLDEELRTRGELFRELGVQDIAAFRDRAGAQGPIPPMPRILFIVDEFQEFFVADDRVAQEASLLLDRLVRQGRAFGIHVILGSQTLGGAYSLARSTLGQMGVRIALPCGEADSRLILSEENAAARLLSRPGEGIYNDANGRLEGNNPFQVVWLPDEERESYLRRLVELAQSRQLVAREAIVFEGNAAARIERNEFLGRQLTADLPVQGATKAWLGEAIEIKEPTSATFSRQSAANLVVLGQEEESAVGILHATLLAVGSRNPRLIYLLDGSLVDSPHHESLANVARALSLPVRIVTRRDLCDSLVEISDLITQRQATDAAGEPDVYLFVNDLGRVRDLRRGDDDFGFSMGSGDGETAKPDKLLATIVKEGPSVGVHVVLWCDSLANLQRVFDRAAQRELGMRVLLQMSSGDSSSLIDSPLASKLGARRAYFHQEEAGILEKFRPYGIPPAEWVAAMAEKRAGTAATSS